LGEEHTLSECIDELLNEMGDLHWTGPLADRILFSLVRLQALPTDQARRQECSFVVVANDIHSTN